MNEEIDLTQALKLLQEQSDGLGPQLAGGQEEPEEDGGVLGLITGSDRAQMELKTWKEMFEKNPELAQVIMSKASPLKNISEQISNALQKTGQKPVVASAPGLNKRTEDDHDDDDDGDGPEVYVNPKQYERILIRREARTRLEKRLEMSKRKPFLHESRHRHAKARKRGPRGRFLTKEEVQALEEQEEESNYLSAPPPPGPIYPSSSSSSSSSSSLTWESMEGNLKRNNGSGKKKAPNLVKRNL